MLCAAHAQATLLAYEGFDYGISVPIAGLGGGTRFTEWDAVPGAISTRFYRVSVLGTQRLPEGHSQLCRLRDSLIRRLRDSR